MASKGSKETFQCDVCSKKLHNFKAYLKHVRIHTPKELLEVWSRCAICEQFFPTDFDRQSHGLKDHHDVLKTIKCQLCPNESYSNKDFFNHAKDHHFKEVHANWNKCVKCEAYRPSRLSMNVHMKSSHKDEDDNFQIILERKIQQIKCKYCPLIFSDSAEYTEHLQSHESQNQKLVISPVNSLISKTGEYECEFCIHEMIFKSKRAFLEHVKAEHYNDISSSWTKCSNCGILHPKHWTDHSCYITTNQNKAKNICPVCDKKFESDEHCWQHMDQLHPNHVIEFHIHACDTCPARRPDKTSLMLHKLSHLGNGSNQGPTIKIISKPLESQNHSFKKILPNGTTYIENPDIKTYSCGICNKTSKGTIHIHFQHAKACINLKRSAISCLYCPQDTFLNFSLFSHHMEYLHKATFKQIVCIWCGMYLPNVEALRSHGLKCAIKHANLSESSWSLCTFCPTIFFFSDLTKSPFFIAHMNNQHRSKIEQSWSFPCPRCNSIFPTIEAAEHHRKLCYKSVPQIILKGHMKSETSLEIARKKLTASIQPKSKLPSPNPSESSLQIISAISSKPKSKLPLLKPLGTPPPVPYQVTYQVCGLCSKTISGKVAIF